VTFAGPLCFSGDLLARDVNICEVSRNDRIVISDAGANTLSLFSRHCSRVSPAVLAFRSSTDTAYKISYIRDVESLENMLSFWD
jgi:diaminopimelate decarboxylase